MSSNHQNKTKSIFLILLILCITLKFTAVDGKVYWVDEVFTSLRISGYSEEELSKTMFSNDLISPQDLQKYQYPSPEKTLWDTVKGLEKKEPQQTPLYFIILRFWTQLFGNSITVIRNFSVFVSVLTIPAFYWLCRELFNNKSIHYFSLSLIATSPFYLLYAQEARSYSLWALTIVLSTAVLLRALRLNNKQNWVLYSLTLIAGFYTFLYSIFVVLGQGIYVLITEKFKFNQVLKSYLLSSTIALIAFIPWIKIIIDNREALSTYTGWQDGKMGFLELIFVLINHSNKIFIDFDITPNLGMISYGLYQGINYLIFGLVVYALYFLIRHSNSRIYLLILSLILPTLMGIILLDLIQGNRSAIAARYFIPCYLGINLAVAYLFDQQLNYGSSQGVKKIWKNVVIFLISLSFLSCINILQAQTWWNKTGGYIPQIAQLINKTEKPLIINEGDFWLISLSHYLQENTKIKVVDAQNNINLPENFSDYFIFHSSSELLSSLQNNQKYHLKPLEDIDNSILYKLELN
jgi:uncharacterized membrane protein